MAKEWKPGGGNTTLFDIESPAERKAREKKAEEDKKKAKAAADEAARKNNRRSKEVTITDNKGNKAAASVLEGTPAANTFNIDYTTPLISDAGNGGGGGGGTAITTAPAKEEELPYYDEAYLANRFGIDSDYASLLGKMNSATEEGFKASNALLTRAESSNVRNQESAYNNYIQDLRARTANSVASGATKGTQAANALTGLLAYQDANKEGINTLNTLIGDTALERNRQLIQNEVDARTSSDEIGKYLGTLATNMSANDINKYVGDRAAEAQTTAARINANATVGAASIGANAASKSAFDDIINLYAKDYMAKGYDKQSAVNSAYNTVTKLYSNNNQQPAK